MDGTESVQGLSIREEFAKAAMQGILSNGRLMNVISQLAHNKNQDIVPITISIAINCADTLVKELSNG